VAQPLPELSLEVLVSNQDELTYLTHAGDDRLFLVSRTGIVRILRGGAVEQQPFLDLSAKVRTSGVEQGMTSIVFHPDYVTNGRLFAHYVQGDGKTVLARFQRSGDPDRADAGSEARLLVIDQPFANHNGGQLHFGPEGYLYLGTGDGGAGFDPQCKGQAAGSLLGKMLRLDVDSGAGQAPFYQVPPDNPFVGPGDPRDEIWALGLRNPWRFSFDRQTGDLYVADVGQNEREEVDFQPAGAGAGANYGWKMLEGTLCLGSSDGCPQPLPPCDSPLYTAPVLELLHPEHCSIIGGYVYRGAAIPELRGYYLYGDFCSGALFAARRRQGAWTTTRLTPNLPSLRSFGEDVDGEIYLLTGTTVFRLVGAGGGGDPGTLELTSAAFEAAEGAGAVNVSVRRVEGEDGPVGVTYATTAGTATAGTDYTEAFGALSWADGEDGIKTFQIPILDDLGVEGDETLQVTLSAPTGGATLGSPTTATVTLRDDDTLPPPCAADAETLCLQGGRFRVTATWATPQGASGPAKAVTLTQDTGYLWFFRETNVETVVKVLNGCGTSFQAFWVFAGGLTNVEVTLTVQDTATGFTRVYENPLRSPFQPIQDTEAFKTCP
jgi:glucose/arabinose dehydrogenase